MFPDFHYFDSARNQKVKDSYRFGYNIGVAEGECRVCFLLEQLLAENRQDLIQEMIQDPELLTELIRKYNCA